MIDDLGTAVEIGVLERIVSLVPSLTETVASWGLTDRLVGVTEYCIRPDLGDVVRVRGTKNPDLEAIIELRPDLVIANREENRRVDVERLRAAGVAVWVTAPDDLAGVIDTFTSLGRVLDAEGPAAELVAALQGIGPPPERLLATFCPIWRDPWISVGTGTIAADLLARSGFAVVPAIERYPRVDLEQVRALEPAVVLLPDEPYAFGEADREVFADWPAAVIAIDGADLTWWGPRTPAAAERFAELAHRLGGLAD